MEDGSSGGAEESFDSYGGLELSLGLSCGGSKAKSAPSHRPSNPNPNPNMMKRFLDHNPNPNLSPNTNPNPELFAGEAIGRGGGGGVVGVDLKRFLDPNPSPNPELAGGSLNATRNLASQLDLSLQDQSIQLELGSAHEGFALNPNPNPNSRVASAAAWGQSGPHQGINFFEHGSASTSVDNTSSSSDTKRCAELPPSEYQRKYQEPRKKQKHLLEDYRLQKQDKPQEERAAAGVHGFRKPGSNGWGGGVNGLVEAPSAAVYDNEGTSQDLSNERDQFKGAIPCPLGSNPDKEYEESTGTASDDVKGGGDAELTWMCSSRETWRHRGEPCDNDNKGDGFAKKSLKACERGQHLAFLMPSAVPSLVRKDGERVSSESEVSEKEGRPSGGGLDGEASSRHMASTSTLNNNSNINSNSNGNGNSNNNGGSSTHPITFPVVPMPYSMPPGMSFPAGFQFPYLVHVAPPPSDAQEPTGAASVPMPMPMSMTRPLNNSFPWQVSPMNSPTSWVPALRPPMAPSYANPTHSARPDSDPAAEERANNRSLGGGNGYDGVSKPVLLPTSMDASSSQGRAPFFNGTMPEPINFRRGGVGLEGSAFHGFAPPPSSLPLNLPEDSVGRGEITKRPSSSSSKRDALLSTSLQQGGKTECSNDADTNPNPNPNPNLNPNLNPHLEEDVSRGVLGGGGALPFEKGSTENILHAGGGLVHGLSHIRPGIVPGMKFGGTGSRPDLPWVSATGPGPDGKTICGVMYRLNQNQVRIVCACHGQHMSSSDFVQHASGMDIPPIPDQNGGVATQFPHTSQAASALG